MNGIWEKRSPEDYVCSVWSGGTTTQLLIAPEGAHYAARDFLWRVSSATVELDESDFTPLPEYERLIATLQGGITLTHNGGAPICLRPYEVHAFSGGDRTHSTGRCTDFNLMLHRGQAEGSMEAVFLGAGEERAFTAEDAAQTLLYAAEGACTVTIGADRVELLHGESLLGSGNCAFSLCAAEGAALMLCRMRRI